MCGYYEVIGYFLDDHSTNTVVHYLKCGDGLGSANAGLHDRLTYKYCSAAIRQGVQ